MPLATGYDEWLALLRSWLDIQGSDITDAQIGYSLTLGQDHLNKVLNSWRMEKVAPLTVPVAGPPTPMAGITDFNRMRNVQSTTDGRSLYASAYNEISQMQAALNLGGPQYYAAPNFYAIEAGNLYTYPMAAAGDIFDIFYYTEVPALSSTVNSNIFTQYHEEALLYSSLVACSQFISEDERTAGWADLLANAVTTINDASKAAKMGSTPVRRKINTFLGAAGAPSSVYSGFLNRPGT